MATNKLENYLRMYRRKSGLTQREVAFLLGFENGTQVLRYEKRHRVPPLRTALACELVLRAPLSELFAGMNEAVKKEVGKRLLGLRAKLETKAGANAKKSETRLAAQKLRWLDERAAPQPTNQDATP